MDKYSEIGNGIVFYLGAHTCLNLKIKTDKSLTI